MVRFYNRQEFLTTPYSNCDWLDSAITFGEWGHGCFRLDKIYFVDFLSATGYFSLTTKIAVSYHLKTQSSCEGAQRGYICLELRTAEERYTISIIACSCVGQFCECVCVSVCVYSYCHCCAYSQINCKICLKSADLQSFLVAFVLYEGKSTLKKCLNSDDLFTYLLTSQLILTA